MFSGKFLKEILQNPVCKSYGRRIQILCLESAATDIPADCGHQLREDQIPE